MEHEAGSRPKTIDPWLVVGAAAYWASIGANYLVPSASWDWLARAGDYLLLAAAVVLAYAGFSVLGVHRGRVACSAVALATSAALGLSVGGMPPSGAPALALLATRYLMIGVFMTLWGLAFASLDRMLAAQNVVASLLVALLLVLLVLLLPEGACREVAMYGLSILSALVMLSGKVPLANRARPRSAASAPVVAGAVVQRLLFGASLVAFECVMATRALAGQPEPALLAIAAAGALALVIMTLRTYDHVYTALPASQLAATCLLVVPFLYAGTEAVARTGAAAAWFAWSSLSAVQLSDLKERLSMSELLVCVWDKALLALSFSVGALMTFPLATAGPELPDALVHDSSVVLVGVLTLVSIYVSAALLSKRKADEERASLLRDREEREERAFRRIADAAGLSERELEVLVLLARGFTSTYIADELGISTGTAKAHFAHIYRKLGVHTKDELLEAVARETS